jgi:hypothetical protein
MTHLSGSTRNVIRSSPHRVVGQFAWVKGEQRTSVPWESRHERDAVRIMAASPAIVTLHAQPFTINYYLDGQEHSYTPDYFVGHRAKPFVLEVKPLEQASLPVIKAGFEQIAKVLESDNLEFRVWTEREYRREPLLSNSSYILRFRSYPVDELDAIRVTSLLEKHSRLSASDIRTSLRLDMPNEALFAMVCFGLIHVDCEHRLGDDPTFSRVPHGN